MAQVSKYLRKAHNAQGTEFYTFYCPGCDDIHQYRVGGTTVGPKWTFNGDVNRPSFSPSLLYFEGHNGGRKVFCHLFVRTGDEIVARLPNADRSISYIDFCGDCPHELSGQIVPLPELPSYMQGDKFGDGEP